MRDGGFAALTLFGLIAGLMLTDLTIEFQRGIPLTLQSFEWTRYISSTVLFI